MRVVVVYESSYCNTHLIANAIRDGIPAGHQVDVVPVAQADAGLLDGADLLLVGGPTHVHGMSRDRTRQAAVDAAHQPGSQLTLDPDATGPGLRAWFESLRAAEIKAAAFDTRVDAPALLTGRASLGISRQLRRHGFREIAEPRSFLVTKLNRLAVGQEASARHWGRQLASTLATDHAPV
jgi:hypothetical protein